MDLIITPVKGKGEIAFSCKFFINTVLAHHSSYPLPFHLFLYLALKEQIKDSLGKSKSFAEFFRIGYHPKRATEEKQNGEWTYEQEHEG